ncbi:protein of unknown function [Lutibacter agarilyticus]|uniref:Chromosome segregation protein n=1 Tax=Lutibacter agarilyticus TaxID=1109740 RepID=A0A238WDT0_9FLAO|nr:DUF349 domain-containing protein [Lutibacter agarilyticus]SNR44433.1 protein of unknown function [Lutibacter agarilyticus]
MLDQEHKLPMEDSTSSSEEVKSTTDNSELKEEIKKIEAPAEVKKIATTEIKLLENKAIEEIEDKIAESSEKVEHTSIELIDYSKFSLEELVAELGKLIHGNEVQSINTNVNNIKTIFNVEFGKLLKQEKEKFLIEGGDIVDFQYSNPLKSTYNSYLYDYKVKRNEFFANQEKQLNDNLEAKLEIIEDLKRLVDNSDDGGVMYKNFKEIQTKWQQTGPVPRAKYNDIWRTYHHHVERFYDLLHISNDLRELDFKHNLEEKLKLVAQAEILADSEDINQAFKELQVLHKLWKEEVGPVAREYRDEVWERFSAATKKVHDKRHDFFKDLKSKYEENIDKKLAVINEIEAVDTSKNTSRNDWQKSINEIEALRAKFFAVGQVPRGKSDKIWAKFKDATKNFNNEKNKFFKDVKKDHLENLNKKKLLIEEAIALKDSDDWESATEVMKKIQSDWKKIGHVPRKYSDKLWKEFKDACNHYFDRLHKKQEEGNQLELGVFTKKKALLKTIKEQFETEKTMTLDKLNTYISEWRELGRVPYDMRHIEMKFNKLLDKIVSNSDIDQSEMEMIKFTNLVNSYLEQKNYRKIDSEQLFVRKKIDESVREIQQLENNIGFISNVSDDNPLVKNVHEQINTIKEKLTIWKTKLKYLRELEY